MSSDHGSTGLTLFSSARAFSGQFETIQRNAITSWVMLDPRPDVILFGDDPGTAGLCRELGIRHVPDVATSELGTPLVSDMFSRAQDLAAGDTCCFLNADIILLPDLYAAIAAAKSSFERFLIVGRRSDLDISAPIDFSGDWVGRLREHARASARLQPEIAIDYFAFRRGTFPDLPPFAIGRSAYDNWLIWHADDLGMPVIDATRFCLVVHQSHDYSSAGGLKAVWEGPEAARAHELVGHWSRYHTISHARFMLTNEGAIVRARGLHYRLARPRRALAHQLRFLRPARRWLKYEARHRLRLALRRLQARG